MPTSPHPVPLSTAARSTVAVAIHAFAFAFAVAVAVAAAVAVAVAAAAPAQAADGRIPIWQRTTIVEPGSYVLTRNLTVEPGDPAITVLADGVDLDLNGFRVTGPIDGYSQTPAIVVHGDDVRVRNGSVRADMKSGAAIRVPGARETVLEDLMLLGGTGIEMDGVRRFRVERVAMQTGFGLGLSIVNAHHGSVVRCEFEATKNGGMVVRGRAVEIRDNRVETQEDGIVVSGEAMVVEGNAVETVYTAIDLTGCTGCRAERNTVTQSYACLVVGGSDNRVLGNLCAGMVDGIAISGDRNLVADNQALGGTGTGLQLAGDDNVYGGNVCRGNGIDFADSGTGNTSRGDNFLPGPQ